MHIFNRSIAAVLLATAAVAHAEVSVITHPAATSMPDQAQVANIFLGKDKSFTGIDLKGWNSTKDLFYTTVTNKNESQLTSYWSGLIFTGKGQPPTSVEDDSAMITRVASDINAIGYVDSASVTDQVKVAFTLP